MIRYYSTILGSVAVVALISCAVTGCDGQKGRPAEPGSVKAKITSEYFPPAEAPQDDGYVAMDHVPQVDQPLTVNDVSTVKIQHAGATKATMTSSHFEMLQGYKRCVVFSAGRNGREPDAFIDREHNVSRIECDEPQ